MPPLVPGRGVDGRGPSWPPIPPLPPLPPFPPGGRGEMLLGFLAVLSMAKAGTERAVVSPTMAAVRMALFMMTQSTSTRVPSG